MELNKMAELRKVEFFCGHMQLYRLDVCSTCSNNFAVKDTQIIPLVLPKYSNLPSGAGEEWRAGGQGGGCGEGECGNEKAGRKRTEYQGGRG
jgi:hypothetical protein